MDRHRLVSYSRLSHGTNDNDDDDAALEEDEAQLVPVEPELLNDKSNNCNNRAVMHVFKLELVWCTMLINSRLA